MPAGVEVGNGGLNPIGKIAAWNAAHRWWVIAAFVTIFVLTIFVMGAVETKTLDYNGEGEAAAGAQLVEDGFEFNSMPSEQLVFSNPSLDVQSTVFRATVQAGPQRGRLRGSRLRPYFATPHGDMMISGCFGLVRAFATRYPERREEIERALAVSHNGT